MSAADSIKPLSRATVLRIRDACLCLAAQRAARRLARHFDTAFAPLGLTNNQFSLLMALNQPEPPPLGRLAAFMAMEPSTLTAAVKVLERRALLVVEADPCDNRSRRLRITHVGVALLRRAIVIWRSRHAALEEKLPTSTVNALKAGLQQLQFALDALERPRRPASRRNRRGR